MVWALWLRKEHNGVRVHLDFDILKGIPVGAEVTTARTCEKAQLKKRLEKGRLYVYDRGYADYELFQKVIDAGSSFVGRVQQNAVFKIVEERSLTTEGAAAGVQFDRIVKLGGKVSGAKLSRTVRIVKAVVMNEPTKSLKYPRKRVASKKTFRTSSDTHELLLVTDRFDLPAELIVLLYKHRWHVELFFKWLKCVMGCRHLLAESEDGVKIQIYAALIAGLLIVLWTGKKPTKATYQVLQFYFLGWVSDDELEDQLSRLKKA
jgi:IS4 transposase